MADKRKRKWGDRKDGFKVKAPGLQTVMTSLMPNRTDCEVYLNETIDVTELLKYLEKKNKDNPEQKTTVFHCFIAALTRMVKERPMMNRFIQGGRIYERYDISVAFVARRNFVDGSDEALLFYVPKETDTIDDIRDWVLNKVNITRKSEHATGGVDALLDTFAAMPRLLMMFLVWIIRCLDFWGINPDFITEGDPNYSTIFLSNLGSIKAPAVYHHLNNYGTNSFMTTIGVIHKEEMLMKDGTKEIRDVINIGVTIDERIGDGFYFVRSLNLIKYIFAHPELLDRPLNEPSGYEYD
ncbi:MAG: 2-oxo acid dehydrogenase subunit E2 [Solobacterium sp.]|nr:2-oxo acid dehydrogenase subunit E2 [Solobacterium sp.]